MVKLLVDEPGTEEAQNAYSSSDGIRTTAIAHVEATAALARMRKGGRLTPAQLRRAFDDLESLWRGIDSHTVSEALLAKAAESALMPYVPTTPFTSQVPSPSPLAKSLSLPAGIKSYEMLR